MREKENRQKNHIRISRYKTIHIKNKDKEINMSKNTNINDKNKSIPSQNDRVSSKTDNLRRNGTRQGGTSRNSTRQSTIRQGSSRQGNNRQNSVRSNSDSSTRRQQAQVQPAIPKPGSNIRTVVKKKSISPRKLGIAIAIAVIMIIGFIVVNSRIDKLKAQKCVPVDNTDHLIGVESMEITDGMLKLSGWCFKNGIDTVDTLQFSQVMVILMNTADENEKYFMSSSITKNGKLNEMFPLKFTDYSYGGFEAKIKASKLDLDNKNYEILFSKMDYAWESDQFCLTGIRSGYSIVNGKLVNNN